MSPGRMTSAIRASGKSGAAQPSQSGKCARLHAVLGWRKFGAEELAGAVRGCAAVGVGAGHNLHKVTASPLLASPEPNFANKFLSHNGGPG